MDITIVAVGRLKAGPEAALIADYAKRLPWTLRLIEVEEKRPITGPERQAREADLLLAAIPAGALVVALDERGRSCSSGEFADFLTRQRDSAQAVVFIIGGADGLDQRLRDRADRLIALGPMTWPHALARVLLIEQIYRAHSIMIGHPYHK